MVDSTAAAMGPPPTPAVALQAAPRESGDPALLLSRMQAALEQRTEEHWRRLRSELEPQLQESTRGLQQELQDSLAGWRAERAAIEGKLQELLAVRDEVSTRLGTMAEESAQREQQLKCSFSASLSDLQAEAAGVRD